MHRLCLLKFSLICLSWAGKELHQRLLKHLIQLVQDTFIWTNGSQQKVISPPPPSPQRAFSNVWRYFCFVFHKKWGGSRDGITGGVEVWCISVLQRNSRMDIQSLAHMTVETETFNNLPSTRWRTRKARGMIQSKSENPKTRRANGLNSSLRPGEDEMCQVKQAGKK